MRLDHQFGHLVVATTPRHPAALPQCPQGRDDFVQPLTPVAEILAHQVELLTHPARSDGQRDPAAASAFTEIGADEARHLKDFQTALNAVTNPGGGASVPVGTNPTPVAITAGPPRSSGTTLGNLRPAVQGEVFAYAKYMRYADQARRDGNIAVAQLFTNAANVELNEHFATLATLAGVVSPDTNTNLTDAINGEQHEADVMYPDYARQAEQAANPQAANLFREIAGEKAHQKAFQNALTLS